MSNQVLHIQFAPGTTAESFPGGWTEHVPAGPNAVWARANGRAPVLFSVPREAQDLPAPAGLPPRPDHRQQLRPVKRRR